MRRGLLTLLALVGVVASLRVTASSTMTQAREAGMVNEVVQLALVALLEVVNVAGTWTWITDRRPRVQMEAAVGVLAASGVTAVCGALTYGPLGLVAPLGLLAAVHLVSRMWSVEDEAPTTVGASAATSNAEPPGVVRDETSEPDRTTEPVRLDRQHGRRRPRVAATNTAEGRAAPPADRAA